MAIDSLLASPEGKSLEFKRDISSPKTGLRVKKSLVALEQGKL